MKSSKPKILCRSSGTDRIDATFIEQVVCQEILIGLIFVSEMCSTRVNPPAVEN
jgi:hypothetical protein